MHCRPGLSLLATFLTATSAWLIFATTSCAETGSPMPPAREAAKLACEAMQSNFSQHAGWFRDAVKTNRPATAWTLSQLLEALLDMTELSDSESYRKRLNQSLRALDKYWDANSNPPGYEPYPLTLRPKQPDKFYDDNAWLGLFLTRTYALTHNAQQLKRAQEVMAFVKSGWAADAAPSPGGIYWTQKGGNRSRNTVSTAGGAELAVQLYLIGGQSQYLDFAKTSYAWVNSTLKGTNGLYWDKINEQCVIDKTEWSYNQGLMIGTATLLYKATGDRKYLQDAQTVAAKALSFYGNGRPSAQNLTFNAIFFRNLMLLNQVAPDPTYKQALNTYAADVWSVLDRSTGLVNSGLAREQAAVVETFAISAHAH